MSSPSVSSETRKFLETTSIRGVPRIVKSKSKLLFLIWLVAVLICTGVLIWQLTLIFMKYFKYPVNTMFQQAPDKQKPIFPDITVCNLCPLVHESEMNVRYSDYVNVLQYDFADQKGLYYIEQALNESDLNSTYDDALNYLISPSFYFNNFPISKSFVVDSNHAPTISCKFFGYDYLSVGEDCLLNVTAVWNADYYKCYKFVLDESYRDNVRGFSAIFYINKYLESQMTQFFYGLQNSHATGLKVAIHAPGTVPYMTLGMNINPGTETSISISQTRLSHLPQPYSDCTSQRTIGILDEVTTYSQDYCFDVCIQKLYVEECRCIWGQRQYTRLQLEATDYTICGNVSLTDANSNVNWSGVVQFICALRTLDIEYLNYGDCYAECHNPCVTYKYSTSISSAAWPHISSQVSFYNTFISGNARFDSTYNVYEELQLLMNSSQPNSTSANLVQEINKQGLIADNFLQLNVVFDSDTFDIRKDAAAIPVEGLGAQIGGVLSLYLGVTIMLVVELLEFLFTLVCICCQSKKGSSNANVQPSVQIQVKSKI